MPVPQIGGGEMGGQAQAVSLGESCQNYLKAILVLKKEKGTIRSVDLARYMGFSKASVSVAMAKLCREGYASMGEDGALELTAAGQAEAAAVYERHCFFERGLTGLGVPPERAHEDACRLEHAISAESFDAIQRRLRETEDSPIK